MKLKNYLTKFFRKFYLYYFKQNYVKEQHKNRKGKCRQCGLCCYNFGMKCFFLTKDNRCKIHKSKKVLGYLFPFFIQCNINPIDEQQQVVGKYKEKCGYYWRKNAKK